MAEWVNSHNLSAAWGGKGNDNFQVSQDLREFKKELQINKDLKARYGVAKNGMRLAFSIPDVVALEILTKFKLDIHHPNFNDNPANKTKLRNIIHTHYPDLVINK